MNNQFVEVDKAFAGIGDYEVCMWRLQEILFYFSQVRSLHCLKIEDRGH